jgi:hypothetical protein
MPVSAILGNELTGLRRRLHRTAAVTLRIVQPRGAASPPSAAPPSAVIPIATDRARSARCSCPCSIQLPGEIA